jgi:iron complex outermembrane receptor protein
MSQPKSFSPRQQPHLQHRRLSIALAAAFAGTAPVLSLGLLAAAPALAQQAAPAQPAAKAEDEGKLTTITVTATKRVQPLQSTPIAITVLSGGEMEELNLNNLATITQQLPTVNFRANASNKDTALFIRGVGTISTSPGVEPTVSMVLDGVVTARPGQATLDLVEVDRIEVLRGPQGTLFGKNASAGVINIVTKAPGKAFEGYADLGLYQGGERRLRLGVGGELAKDLVRASISGMTGKFDGNVTNVFDGSKVNGYDRQGVRGRVEITPAPALKIGLIADYSKAEDTTPTGVPVSTDVAAYPTGAVTANPLYGAAVAPVTPARDNRQINSDMLTRVSDTNQGVSAQVDWGFAGHQLTSITAQRKWKNTQFQDQDRLATLYRQFNRIADRGDLDFEQTSQELRIASTGKGMFDYVGGLFYLDAKTDEQYRRDVTRCPTSTEPPLPSGLVPCTTATTVSDNGVANYGVRNKSQSVFGEGTVHFAPTVRAIAGLRWTQDDLSYYHGRVATNTGVPGVQATRATVNGSTRETAWSGRIGPQWDVMPDTMLFFTASRGYKGPAYNVFFNMTATQDNVLAPETSNSYELGLKTELLDKRLRVNVAAFQTNYEGYQANVPDLVNGVIVTRLINAGEVSTKGVEVDVNARPLPPLSISASVAYIKARVKQFNCPPGAAASCDINGKPLPFSPDWKAALRAKYTMPLVGRYAMDYGVDVTWQSRTNFDLQQQPDSYQPEYSVVNAAVGLADTAAGWRVALVAKNLFDKSYSTFVQSSGSNINRYVPRDDRRYFGVTARWDF